MKTVANVLLRSMQGQTLRMPRRDAGGNMFPVDGSGGVMAGQDGFVADLLYELVLQIPKGLLTLEDTEHQDRLYNQIKDGLTPGSILHVEDSEWEWVIAKLRDDRIGPPFLGAHLPTILRQLSELIEDKGQEE